MFGAKNEELPQGASYITPGIHTVQITDLVVPETTGNKYFELFLKLDGAEDKDAKAFRFYITEKSQTLIMNKFYEIVRAVDPSLENIVADSLEAYIAQMKPKMVNRKYKQLFKGVQNKLNGPFFPDIPLSSRTIKDPSPTIACGVNEEPPFTFDEAKHLTSTVEVIEQSVKESDASDWE